MRLHLAALSLAVVAVTPAAMLGQATTMQNPTVFSIYRESVKPGKGSAHDAHETAWSRALAGAKTTDRFVAIASVTGPNEIWYIQSYASWAEYQKSSDMNRANPALAAIDKQYRALEGDYLSDARGMTARARDDLSYDPRGDLSDMRYVSVTRVSVRPGHAAEYEEARRTVKAAHETAHATDHFAIWEVTSGAPAGTFFTLVARRSLAELDSGATVHGPAYIAALGGPEGQKRLDALSASAVISQETDHFEVTPSQSVPPDEWVKANPGFWKPKVVAPKKTP